MDHVSLVRAMRKILRYPANLGRLPDLYGDHAAPVGELVEDAAFALATPECLDWMNSRMGTLNAISIGHAGVKEAIARFDAVQAGAPGKWGTPFLFPLCPSPVARVDSALVHEFGSPDGGVAKAAFWRFYVADRGDAFLVREEDVRVVLPGSHDCAAGERRVIARAVVADSDPRAGGSAPRGLREPALDGVFPDWLGDFWLHGLDEGEGDGTARAD